MLNFSAVTKGAVEHIFQNVAVDPAIFRFSSLSRPGTKENVGGINLRQSGLRFLFVGYIRKHYLSTVWVQRRFSANACNLPAFAKQVFGQAMAGDAG
jgi:hypothetical protein